MKKYWINLLALAILAGCTAEPVVSDVPQDEDLITIIADAGEDAGTRTVRQESGAVYWSPGDEIIVFSKAGVA